MPRCRPTIACSSHARCQRPRLNRGEVLLLPCRVGGASPRARKGAAGVARPHRTPQHPTGAVPQAKEGGWRGDGAIAAGSPRILPHR